MLCCISGEENLLWKFKTLFLSIELQHRKRFVAIDPFFFFKCTTFTALFDVGEYTALLEVEAR